MTPDRFTELVATVVAPIAGRPLDAALEADLNAAHPAGGATFRAILDACREAIAAGWLVYGPGTAHHPTVAGGRALVLYLLPRGAIEFTRT
jgi:hypothetical protein